MLNQERIAELRDEVGDDGFAEVIGIFCEEVEEVLDQLAASGASDMAGRLHFLKGSALNIGMERVGALCLTEEGRLLADPGYQPDIAAIRDAYLASRKVLESRNW